MTTPRDKGGPGPAWFTSNGRPYRGEVGEDADGLPFGAADLACGNCAGSGTSPHGREGRTCRVCMGERTVYAQFRIYDADGLARYKATKAFRGGPKGRKVARPGGAGRKPPFRKSAGAPYRGEGRAPARGGKGAGRPAAARKPPPGRTVEAMRETYEEYRAAHARLFERAEGVGNEFVRGLLDSAREWGGLTEAQRAKMEEVVSGIERARAAHAGSDYVGDLRQRFVVEVTCTEHRSFTARKVRGRGTQTLHATTMADDAGNVYLAVTPVFSLSPGDRAKVNGTVRGHEEREGYRLTLLNRVVILEHVPAPPGWTNGVLETGVTEHAASAGAEVDGDYEADFDDMAPAGYGPGA